MQPAFPHYAHLLAPDVEGWFNHPEALLDLVARTQPARMVEVGTWLGASAIPTARLLATWGGRLDCVDTWQGSPELQAHNRTDLFERCQRNLARYGLHNVTLHRATSEDAAARWPTQVGMVYLDALHDEHSVAMDLLAWWPHVAPGGILAGDDYGNADFPGVTAAWEWFLAANRYGEPGFEHGAGRPGLVWLYKPIRSPRKGTT